MVRSVTRQLESEWDDVSRAEAEGLARYHAEVHSDGCGLHPAILAEPDVYQFKYDEQHCPACAAKARTMRMVADQDSKTAEKFKEASASAKRPYDGRRLLLRAKTPEEIAAAAAKKAQRVHSRTKRGA